MRTWVIPDVHGCLMTLRTLVEELIALRKDDTLIFLGDLIDRGPDSKGVIDYIRGIAKNGIKILLIKGNHEDYLVKVYRDELSKRGIRKFFGLKSGMYKEWMTHGGAETMKSFSAKKITDIPLHYIEWIESFRYYLKWNKFLIVHAGFNFKLDDIFSDTQTMMWARDYTIIPEKLGKYKIIHGHVPVSLDFIFQSVNSDTFRFIDLDNGAYYVDKPGYGNLLALELNTLELLVQPNVEIRN